MNHRLFAGFVLMTTLLLVACGGTPAVSSPDAPQTAASNQAPTQASVPASAATQPQGEITVWNFQPAEAQETWQGLVDAFNEEHPGITVKMQNFPEDEFFTKLTASLAAGTPPDVWTWFGSTEEFERGHVQALDEFMQRDNVDPKQWFPIAQERLTHDGKWYGVPLDVAIALVVYNKDLFDAKGIPYPDGTWTVDEFTALAEKLTDKDTGIYGTDFGGWVGIVNVESPMGDNWGADMISPDGRTAVGYLDSDKVEQVLDWSLNMYHSGWSVPAEVTESLGGYMRPFAAGKVAISRTALWSLNIFRDAPFKWDVTSFPTVEGGEAHSWMDSQGLLMAAQSQNKEAAWQFMKFVSGEEAGAIIAEHGSWGTPNIRAWETSGLDKDPVMQHFYEQRTLPVKTPSYLIGQYQGECLGSLIRDAWQRAQRTQEDIGPLLDAAAANGQECLDKNYGNQ